MVGETRSAGRRFGSRTGIPFRINDDFFCERFAFGRGRNRVRAQCINSNSTRIAYIIHKTGKTYYVVWKTKRTGGGGGRKKKNSGIGGRETGKRREKKKKKKKRKKGKKYLYIYLTTQYYNVVQ